MSELSEFIGTRIRNIRTQQGLSQEKLAELSGFHHTYIGQIERGEKNATLESIEKIADALDVSLSKLFEKWKEIDDSSINNIPLMCYELLASKDKASQKKLYEILLCIDEYRNLK